MFLNLSGQYSRLFKEKESKSIQKQWIGTHIYRRLNTLNQDCCGVLTLLVLDLAHHIQLY